MKGKMKGETRSLDSAHMLKLWVLVWAAIVAKKKGFPGLVGRYGLVAP